MRFWLLIACCLLATGVLGKHLPLKTITTTAEKRQNVAPEPDAGDDDEDDEPKRLVVYYNFEKVLKHHKINDKSGYENSGAMETGGEILKYTDKDYTCNQAARLYDHDIIMRGDTFQAKPKKAITIAAWVKLEEKNGQHSIFDTVGQSHAQGQFHFEVNDGVCRWFHRDEKQKVVFETMAHSVPKGKWTHLAATYDSKTKQAKIFIDGEIKNQSIGDGQLSRDWGIRAGIGDKEKCRPLKGAIDEFRIYNYALKNDEIKALVTACRAGGADENANANEAPAAVENANPAAADQTASTRTLAPTNTKEKSDNGGGTLTTTKDEKQETKTALKK